MTRGSGFESSKRQKKILVLTETSRSIKNVARNPPLLVHFCRHQAFARPAHLRIAILPQRH